MSAASSDNESAVRSAGGWILLRPEDLPDGWRTRGISLMMIPLFPTEMAKFLQGRYVGSALDSTDEQLARLVARGRTPVEIADDMSLTTRSVYRRLAKLQKLLGVASRNELATELARRFPLD